MSFRSVCMDALSHTRTAGRFCRMPILAAVMFLILFNPAVVRAATQTHTNSPQQFQAPVNSPILPAPIDLEDLWPDLTLNPRSPSIVPAGFTPLYDGADWREYQKQFTDIADGLPEATASQRAEVAGQILTASEHAHDLGLARLLAIRAFALTYQSGIGSPVAQQSLRRYLELVVDPNDPVQVAPIWTMSHLLAYLRATPAPERQQYAVLAERANVQLTMDLLAMGQLDAANRVVRMLVIHEIKAVRENSQLMSQMGIARTLVAQTNQMIAQLDVEYAKMWQGDAQAGVPIYLYSSYIGVWPQMRAAILRRWPTGPAAILDDAIQGSAVNSDDRYKAGQLLSQAAEMLPAGILRDRTMYQAMEKYNAFLNDPATQNDRIKRTLAQLAVQQLFQEGARPQPVLNPLKGLLGPNVLTQSTAASGTAGHSAPR